MTSLDSEGEPDTSDEYTSLEAFCSASFAKPAATSSAPVQKAPKTSVKARKPAPAASKPSLSPVTINGVTLKPTVVFDTFWYWVAERKAMDDRRRAGEPAPWTDDPILKKYFFCNSFRVLDKVSQFIVTDVIEKGSQDPVELVFRVLLFNSFTKIQTWQLLDEELGPIKWSTYDRAKYDAVLGKADFTLYTGAFIKPASRFGFKKNFQNHLALLENMMENEMPYKLLGAPTLADVYEYIISFPGMGDFTTYQLMLNLSYTNVLNFHPNDFVIAGPGSISGLVKMFGTSFRHAHADNPDFAIDVMRWLVDTQDEHFLRLGISFSKLGPQNLPMDVSDVEHSVCEVDKYCRAKHPSIKGMDSRTNMKRVYDAFGTSVTTYPAQAALPKAWDHPKRATPNIREGPLHVDKRYEVARIAKHRTTETGVREFLVFWVGYPDSDATWEPESSLMQDAAIIVKEYLEEHERPVLSSSKAKTSKSKAMSK